MIEDEAKAKISYHERPLFEVPFDTPAPLKRRTEPDTCAKVTANWSNWYRTLAAHTGSEQIIANVVARCRLEMPGLNLPEGDLEAWVRARVETLRARSLAHRGLTRPAGKLTGGV